VQGLQTAGARQLMPYAAPDIQQPARKTAAPLLHTIVAALCAVVAFCVLALLVQRVSNTALLLLSLLPLGGIVLLSRPELAAAMAIFAFYINVPAILTQQHGVPSVVAGAIVLLFGVPLLQSMIVGREPLRWDATLLMMGAYLAVLLAASIGVRHPDAALDRIQKFAVEGLFFYWLVVNVVRTHASLMRMVRTMLMAGALLGALTTYQEVTGDVGQTFGGLAQRNHEFGALQQLDASDPAVRDLIQAYQVKRGSRSARAKGPTDESNRFAQILVVLLPLAVLAYRSARSRWGRAAAMASLVLILSGLIFSDSRGAFATLVVLVLLAAYVAWIRPAHVLAGILAGLLIVPLVAPRYVHRVASLAGLSTLADDGPGVADGAIRGRAATMWAAAHVFLDHPIQGVGPGQYRAHYSAEYRQRDPRFHLDSRPGVQAHSLYLELAAETGVVGLTVFLAIFGGLLLQLHHARRRWAARRPDLADLATAFMLVLIAYLGTAVFLHLAIQRYLWLIVALASAAVHCLHAAERDERAAWSPWAHQQGRLR
jgi:putative inorganic carbon (hco3(-)) transporter